MNRVFVAVSLTVGLIAAVGPTSAASAATAEASGPFGSILVAIEDSHFEASACAYVPVVVRVQTDRPWVNWEVELVTRFPGSSSPTRNWIYGQGSGTKSDEIIACSYPGTWRVTGTVKMRDDSLDPSEEFEAPIATSFVMSRAKTALRISSIKKARLYWEISGRLTIQSKEFGVVGLDGLVVVEMRKGKRWVQIGVNSADSRGRFTIATYEAFPRGTIFRAAYDGTSTTLRSLSKPFRY